MIFNENTNSGIITVAGADGAYGATVAVDFTGVGGNVIEVWQRDTFGDSPPRSHVVRPPP